MAATNLPVLRTRLWLISACAPGSGDNNTVASFGFYPLPLPHHTSCFHVMVTQAKKAMPLEKECNAGPMVHLPQSKRSGGKWAMQYPKTHIWGPSSVKTRKFEVVLTTTKLPKQAITLSMHSLVHSQQKYQISLHTKCESMSLYLLLLVGFVNHDVYNTTSMLIVIMQFWEPQIHGCYTYDSYIISHFVYIVYSHC